MAHNSERVKYLFQLFLKDTATAEEAREFWEIMSDLDEEDPLKDTLKQLWQSAEPERRTGPKDWSNAQSRINELLATPEKKTPVLLFKNAKKWTAAAAILLILTGSFWLFNSRKKSGIENTGASAQHQVVPGSDKAILTLTDGSTVILDSAASGTIAHQGIMNLVKQPDGQLIYDEATAGVPAQTGPVQYNTLSIPRGGQYRLSLPDGTLVWLNSATQLTFPVRFIGEQRVVKLSGEAYFDVKPNIKPFIVQTDGVDIKVLGTKFNVSAYEDDESIVTTLTEGKVSVENPSGNGSSILTPGSQALYNRTSKRTKLNEVDTYLYTSWKDGKFYFKKEKLGVIMKKLSRWYDVNLEYQDPQMANKTFTGVALRTRSIEQLLNMINLTTEVKYKLEDRKLTILQTN